MSVSLCHLASVKSKNAFSQQSTSWKHVRPRICRKAQRGSCQCVAHRNFMVAVAEPSYKARPTRQQTHQRNLMKPRCCTPLCCSWSASCLANKTNYWIGSLRIYRAGYLPNQTSCWSIMDNTPWESSLWGKVAGSGGSKPKIDMTMAKSHGISKHGSLSLQSIYLYIYLSILSRPILFYFILFHSFPIYIIHSNLIQSNLIYSNLIWSSYTPKHIHYTLYIIYMCVCEIL